MILRKYLSTIIFAVALLPTVANSAIITTYTDRNAFIAALNGLNTIEEDFNAQDLNLFTSAFNLDLGDFSVSSSDVAGDQIGIVDVVYDNDDWWDAPKPANLGSVDGTRFFGLNGSSGGPSFDVSFSTERFVFGFDWLDGDVTDSYAMTVLGQTFEGPPFDSSYLERNSQYRGFFGIISDESFSDVSFFQTAAGGDIAGFGIDNLITSGIDIVTCSQDPTLPECTASAVPEPSSMAILGLSLIGLVARRKIKL